MSKQDDDDESRRPEDRTSSGENVGPGPGERTATGRFAPGSTGNPGGQPKTSKAFREQARDMSQMALKKLYSIALQPGVSMPQVRACEIIIERAWGKTAPAKTGPAGGPIDTRFHGAVRSAIEELVATTEAERLRAQAEADGPKN